MFGVQGSTRFAHDLRFETQVGQVAVAFLAAGGAAAGIGKIQRFQYATDLHC